MKNIVIILFLLKSMILYSTPEEQEILSDPLTYSEWDYCFIVAKDKRNPNDWIKLKNGGEIKKMMIAQNLKQVYFRDCESEKKWRKLKRK